MYALDPVIAYWLIAAFSLLYGEAASHKWRSLPHFRAVLARYDVMPSRLIPLATPLIAALESAVAIGLWFPSIRRAATQAGVTLLLLYAMAIALNLQRGRRDLDCGCSGPLDRRPIASWMVVRNVLLAAVLGLSQGPWQTRAFESVDALTLSAGLLVTALIYRAADQLLARVLPAARRLQGLS